MRVPFGRLVLPALATVATALPTLLAFNVPPSATFFNQAAALVGWGVFLLVLAAGLSGRTLGTRSPGHRALTLALLLLAAAALASSWWAHAPWSLTLSSAATLVSALLAVGIAAGVQRAGQGAAAFRALCVGLVVAGVASSAIGLVQVFAPALADGNWIATAALPGRAAGNLRQPNHLSSLLLWSIVGAVWLGEAKVLHRLLVIGAAMLFIYVVVLTASRTGAIGMLTLAAWGLLDRRLSRNARVVLVLAPILYGLCWWAMTVWAGMSHQSFGGQTRFGGSGDLSASRFAIWSNTLALIASHPWLGVGFGEFNFAWTLTPFPDRPIAFFDHTHNLVLNFLVELGVPLGLLVTGLMTFALWTALRNALADGRQPPASEPPVQRAAFVVVFLVAVHSMLEYPLWYAYYLLPTAFAFGLCLERPDARDIRLASMSRASPTRPHVLAAMALVLGGTLALYDYLRVVVIFAPPANAGPLSERIDRGRDSVLFGHHADYAAVTIAEHPGTLPAGFARAPHFLLDARLMMAWAKGLAESGEIEKARHVAWRLREFRNDQADAFFAPCATPAIKPGTARPFQCEPPAKAFRFEDFR